MAYKNSVLKFADKYPLVVLIVAPLGIKMMFDQYRNMSGLGQAVFTDSGNEMDDLFNKTGKTGPTAPGTGQWDTVMPSPSGPQVRYDADYHAQPIMMEPLLEENRTERPLVQPPSVRHNYETAVFAGINGMNRL